MKIQEMEGFALGFLKGLTPAPNGARVIGLRGELGAGKTTFTQICARLLGVAGTVSSPTFVIWKKYALNNEILGSQFEYLVHVDAYRLKSGEELKIIGWQETIADPKNLVFIEWPQLVADVIPENTMYIDFKHVDDTSRDIQIS